MKRLTDKPTHTLNGVSWEEDSFPPPESELNRWDRMKDDRARLEEREETLREEEPRECDCRRCRP